MAKKKTKKKKSTIKSERSNFWPLAGAVILCTTAFLLLIGGFGSGGSLPVSLFNGAYWTLGWVAYLTPMALFYYGVHKFISNDYQIPLGKTVSMLGVLLLSVTWAHIAFVDQSVTGDYFGGNGGAVGSFIGGMVLKVLDKWPASSLFLILSVLACFLAFGISPKIILKLGQLFSKPEKTADTDLADLKAKANQHAFQLNEGVPVEHNPPSKAPRPLNLKAVGQNLSNTDDHQALTSPSDPDWQFPSTDLLNQKQDKADAGDVEGNAEIIKETFANFNFDVTMEGANIGPRVTQYTLRPPTGVKLTKLTALENNLALDLAAHSIRMEAPIPGKRLVGIEVPNVRAAMVRISSLLQSEQWQKTKAPLAFIIGKDIAGVPIVGDLGEMPHLLVAGQTKSGKSVMINSFLTSLLYRNSPADLKLILVDPKLVELAPYNDIPHLLTPVITEPEKCISALKWSVAEMERRYRMLAAAKTRNITEYNNLKTEEGMPYIVIVIDELAELMMMAARDSEALVVRIAQKARAVGIHLVLATQRPSVNVITGLIKANVPARVAFTTTSQVDSRTIIDRIGAEKLLGQGDMLYATSDMARPKRVQGAFISTEETAKVTDFIRAQRPPRYDDEVVSQPVQLNGRSGVVAEYGDISDSDDDLWRDAVQVVIEGKKASTSLLQRRLRIGYARAARLIETMEEKGIVGPADGARPREVLVSSVDEAFGGSDQMSTDDEVYDENFPD